MTGFEDRTVSLGAPEQLSDLGGALSSRTRLAVLAALIRADRPLNINELARRVGVDASPVRSHLELLVREHLAKEVDSPGRERLFETGLTDIVVTLENAHRDPSRKRRGPEPKAVTKLQRKLDALRKEADRIEERARKIQEEMEKAWTAAAPRAK